MESIDLISIRDSLVGIAEGIKQDRDDLYQKLLEICGEIDSLFYQSDEYSWPMTISNFCRTFEMETSTVNSNKKYLTKGVDYFVEGSGRNRAACFTKSGALIIFQHSRSERGTRYLKKYGLSLPPKEEHLYINTIKYAMRRFELPKKKILVKTSSNNYEIDLYLENTKLAIECDEHDHYGQEYVDQLTQREEDIFKELGCRFLRFNPHEPDFNVGEVINVIFHHIFGKSINGEDPIDYYMKKRQRKIRERISITEEMMAEFE